MVPGSWSVCTSSFVLTSPHAFNRSRKLSRFSVLCLTLAVTLCGTWKTASAQSKAATTTTLSVTSTSSPVTTVASGSVVALTASVKAGTTALTTGQVNFCDASASYCTDIHLLGTAQLTSAGTAVLRFRPRIGGHSYKAVFLGINSDASSSSSASGLTVTGKNPTITTIAQSGNPGNYTLTATVGGIVNASGTLAPTGTVSFLDTTTGNSVLGTAAVGSGTLGLSFLNSSNPPDGDLAWSAAVGDFNGDGIPDLAIANYGDSTVTILLGKGDGTFTQAVNSPVTVGQTPYFIAVGDFNGDGIPDLATANLYGGSVTVLLGAGDGTFAQATNSPITVGNTFQTPQAVAIGDFNGDGIPDLVVTTSGYAGGPGTMTVLLGKGDGTFTTTADSPVAAESSPISISVADFNADGKADLAVVNSAGPDVTILLGNGDGTFTAATDSPITVGNSPLSVVAGDFNGDGKIDLAVANSCYDCGNVGSLTILIGNGNGTFTQAENSPVMVGNDAVSIAVGDFNGDGKADLGVANSDDGTASILLGRGDGTFTQATNTPVRVGDFPQSVAVGDFTGEGFSDLAVANSGTEQVTVLLSQSAQATATINGVSPIGAEVHEVVASYPGDTSYSSSISATTALTAGVATPVISPASGTYTSVQTVTITDTTPGTTIYYEATGSLQTSGFVLYTGPLTVSGEGYESIQAYAVETGYQQSGYAAATYTLNLPSATTPVISLASGVYPSAQTVTISDAMPGATIYYTTNGSWPTTNSAQYTGPVTVSSSETLVATAIAYGYSMSVRASAQYIIASSSSSFIYTIAGNESFGYSGDGGPATLADINTPAGAVLDKSGNLYIADQINNLVRKVAAGTGVITTFAGNGTAGYTGDGGPAASAELYDPFSLALDNAGNLYISDAGNNVVRKVTATTGIITTYAGNGTVLYSGDGGAATSAGLGYLEGIAMDGSGNLFVAESGYERVRKIAANTGTISTVAGSGQGGYSGDGGPATTAALLAPTGVAIDRFGNLYIADFGNNVIREVTASSGVISTVAGNGYGAGIGQGGYSGDGGPATNAELYFPQSVAVDGAGNLYIADSFNQVIRKVTASSAVISTVIGNGPQNPCRSFGGDGGPANSATLCYPQGVSVDGAGNLYVVTGDSRVREATVSAAPPTALTAAPAFSISAGTYASPQTVTLTDTTPGAAIYVTLDGTTPSTVSPGYNGPVNVSGTVTIKAIAAAPGYLPSTPVTVIYTITSSPASVITTVAGNGSNGFTGAGGPAASSQLGSPEGVALDTTGNLYFSDSANNVVWMVSAKTGDISIAAGNRTAGYSGDGGPATNAGLNSPQGVATDSAGNVYIADSHNNVVRKVMSSTGLISTVAGNGRIGSPGNVGDGGVATSAELNNPAGVAFDRSDNLYIADSNNLVRMVSASTGIITTIAGNGNYGFSGDGGPATSAAVQAPNALAIDKVGNLYVAAQGDGRVRKVTAGTGVITTVAGNGDQGVSGDGALATSAEISVEGLALDSAGNLYISSWPDAIREVAAGTGVITRVAGNGYTGYSGDGGSATIAELLGPQGISFDAAGNLFIADAGNYRVRKVVFSSATPVIAATPVFSVAGGTYSSAQTVTITDATPGATIFYTTDGTTPTASSPVYTGPITVSSSETLEAIATATGYKTSAVATAAYTINIPIAATPTLSPTAGTYAAVQTVTITDATPGATIYYTTDRTTPTASSPVYTGPITVSSSETIEAIATAAGYKTSAVATAAYSINIAVAATPMFSPAAGTYTSVQRVTISDGTAGATIYYTTDGTTPTASSPVYTGPITVSSSETVEAIATAAGYKTSAVATAAYSINIPTNTLPVVGSMSPAFVSEGGATFTLTVTGSGFTSGATVYWGATSLSTQFLSTTKLTAQVPASDITGPGITAITVKTPTPGGGTSNSLQFEVDSAASGSTTPPSFNTLTATVAPGSTATYPVTLPSSATSVSAACLNLPSGAACSYSATSGAVKITTSSTTPAGTYQITVVFTETEPGAAPAAGLLPILLLPLLFVRRKLTSMRYGLTAYLGLLLLAGMACMSACGGGGNSGSTSTSPLNPTHQVTSSGIVSLTIQ